MRNQATLFSRHCTCITTMPDIYADKLTRSAAEGRRLNGQFDLLTRNIGYLIHPRIAAALPPSPRIADIGTGTGHFLQCVQESGAFPNATLDGYDISSSMYPQPLPKDINLKVLDMKQPVPEELHGVYDLVHARVLVAAILPTEWTALVRNLTKLLKPGGWLQWGEGNFISATFLRGGALESSPTDTLIALGNKWKTEMRERFECGWSTLPEDMRAAGLDSVDSDCVSSDRLPETRKEAVENGMTAIFSWLRALASKGVGMTNEELDVAEKRANEEIEAGGYVRYDVYVVTGKKVL
ncbi:S-adenosyl-L-methionine-dependent methyltransferase [Annulohypoxylon maeteangense]|uniref:S-adenosyl-L-methionine-dependent methyltransferase n=1 Tax=Annulohypoxylon maeteangense TaxID=1927788 RepID=UPI00200895FC|nr:S-adenosyl-L-methionine-dependent methyltransferase [Annulohypoxylon maeteangense]KAI0885721.1 S-adenosyl-L-methionine-dependent methyltransferase [Annulohypoxylon maeteangense]